MDMQIELNLEREEAEALPYATTAPPEPMEAGEGGGSLHARFVDPVSVIVTVGVAIIAERIVDHWLRSQEQGVMIDLRREQPLISRVSGVPTGVLLIVGEDGSKTLRRYHHDDRSSIRDAIAAAFEKREKGG